MPNRTYPRNIGISVPSGEGIYEIVVVGKDRIGVLRDLAEIIASHGISLVETGMYQAFDHGEFVFAGYGDFRTAKCNPQELKSELKKLSFVIEVQVDLPASKTFDRHLFPIVISGGERVIVLRMESFLKVEKRLEEAMGSGGGTIMYEVGRDYGLEVVNRYKELYLHENEAKLLEILRSGARATGWGLFDFHVENPKKIFVRVEEPTMSDTSDGESRFTYGIVGGLIEGVYGRRFNLERSDYDRENRELKLIFTAP